MRHAFSQGQCPPAKYIEPDLLGGLVFVLLLKQLVHYRRLDSRDIRFYMPRTLVTDLEQVDEYLKKNEKVVLFFWASWNPGCSDIDNVLDIIESEYGVTVVRIEAEKATEVSMKFDVRAVPLCLFYVQGREMGRVEGVNPMEITERVEDLYANGAAGHELPDGSEASLDERLDKLTRQSRIMLFMKGSPDNPRCGFSQKAVNALRAANCTNFGYFDILTDEHVRQGLKAKSNWPTYPQLYVDGQLVGGCDIILEMASDGSLVEELK